MGPSLWVRADGGRLGYYWSVWCWLTEMLHIVVVVQSAGAEQSDSKQAETTCSWELFCSSRASSGCLYYQRWKVKVLLMLRDINCWDSAHPTQCWRDQHTKASTYIHFVKAVRFSPPKVQVLQTGGARLAVSMLTSVDSSDIHTAVSSQFVDVSSVFRYF